MLYRSEVMCISEDVREVTNIRLNLERHVFKKRSRKLLNQNAQRFTVKIQPLDINDEKENLYENQKIKFKGFIFDNLKHFFALLTHNPSVFDTQEVCVYDGDKLVAVSFFDLGRKTLVSLLGLYDMAYTKYSLGTYTMLLEIAHGQTLGYKFYYPGYIIGGDSTFDYKLRIGDFQYYDWRGMWKSMHKLPQEVSNTSQYKQKTQELATELAANNILFKKILYPFFSFGYLSYGVKNPSIYIITDISQKDRWLTVTYLVEDDCYTVGYIHQYETIDVPNMTCTADFYNEDMYCMNMLDYDITLLETPDLKQAIDTVKTLIATLS